MMVLRTVHQSALRPLEDARSVGPERSALPPGTSLITCNEFPKDSDHPLTGLKTEPLLIFASLLSVSNCFLTQPNISFLGSPVPLGVTGRVNSAIPNLARRPGTRTWLPAAKRSHERVAPIATSSRDQVSWARWAHMSESAGSGRYEL